MNATLKKVLVISLKKAIVAVGTSSGVVLAFHSHVNFETWRGVLKILEVVGCTAGTAEIWYWWPKVMSWARSGDD